MRCLGDSGHARALAAAAWRCWNDLLVPPAETGGFGGKNSQILCVGMGEERVQAGICAGPQPEGDAPGRRGVKEEVKPEEMRGGGSAGVTCSGMTGR